METTLQAASAPRRRTLVDAARCTPTSGPVGHPALGEAYDEGRRRGEAERAKVFPSWPDTVWRAGTDAGKALAVYALLVSLESYDMATGERGWSVDRLEQWWTDTLAELLPA